jgi:ATP-binding cassette subfamily B protein
MAEADLYRRFTELARGKTVILISHRLGSVRLADRILVLSSGRITESGSHDRLMKLGREYAAMYRSQASWYEDRRVAAND